MLFINSTHFHPYAVNLLKTIPAKYGASHFNLVMMANSIKLLWSRLLISVIIITCPCCCKILIFNPGCSPSSYMALLCIQLKTSLLSFCLDLLCMFSQLGILYQLDPHWPQCCHSIRAKCLFPCQAHPEPKWGLRKIPAHPHCVWPEQAASSMKHPLGSRRATLGLVDTCHVTDARQHVLLAFWSGDSSERVSVGDGRAKEPLLIFPQQSEKESAAERHFHWGKGYYTK